MSKYHNSYNLEIERTWPMPVKIILLTVEADTMKQAHGLGRTQAYLVDEFNTPEPEEIAIRGVKLLNQSQNKSGCFNLYNLFIY